MELLRGKHSRAEGVGTAPETAGAMIPCLAASLPAGWVHEHLTVCGRGTESHLGTIISTLQMNRRLQAHG